MQLKILCGLASWNRCMTLQTGATLLAIHNPGIRLVQTLAVEATGVIRDTGVRLCKTSSRKPLLDVCCAMHSAMWYGKSLFVPYEEQCRSRPRHNDQSAFHSATGLCWLCGGIQCFPSQRTAAASDAVSWRRVAGPCRLRTSSVRGLLMCFISTLIKCAVVTSVASPKPAPRKTLETCMLYLGILRQLRLRLHFFWENERVY